MSNQQGQVTNMVTGKVRLSYVHTSTPYANQPNQEPKYSVTMLIPKSDYPTMQSVQSCINAASQQGVSGKWNGVRPAQMIGPVWDGDGLRKNGEAFSAECKGHWVLTASSKTKPQIVDANVLPILDPTEIYSGIYARVSINFFAYFNSGNKGVGCGLGPIQKLSDGEPLGNQMTAESAFGGTGYNQPAPQYQQHPGQQQQYGQQPQYQQQQYAPPAPVAQPQQPYAPPVQQYGQQPQYQQQPPQYAPQAPTAPQYAPQVQYDPITGMPIPAGGVMGL